MDLRNWATRAGFRAFELSRAHRVLRPMTGGIGTILMMHHVRPEPEPEFAPDKPLAITPEFLEIVIETLRDEGFEIVDLDRALYLIYMTGDKPRFAVLTFDDGFRDVYDYALPILRRHAAPFTIYVTPGLVDRDVRPWWSDLGHLIRRTEHLELDIGSERHDLPTISVREKNRAFSIARNALRRRHPREVTSLIETMSVAHGVEPGAPEACMGWDDLAELAADPLCTIGAHTMTHAMLSTLSEQDVRDELQSSKRVIEQHLGIVVDHLAYPFGDAEAIGSREIRIARELGFRSATTTRPGMITQQCAMSPTALPRLSVNGHWQDRRYLEILLTGAPFALFKGVQKLGRGQFQAPHS